MNDKELIVVGALVVAMVLGLAALIGGPSELQSAQDVAAEAAEQDRAARDSRAWVLQAYQRNVCGKSGKIAVWVADQEVGCVPEWRNP